MEGWTDDTVGGGGGGGIGNRQNDTKRIRKFGRGREEKGGKLADGGRTDGRRESRAGPTVGRVVAKKGGRGREEKVSCYAFQMPQPHSLD